MTLFYKEISILETKIRNSKEKFSLRRITIWSIEPLDKLRLISNIIDEIESSIEIQNEKIPNINVDEEDKDEDDHKGVILISKLIKFQKIGDPNLKILIDKILNETCEPIYQMILNWIKFGELNDPFKEFFIKKNENCKQEDFWNLKFLINEKMILKNEFISNDLSKKVLIFFFFFFLTIFFLDFVDWKIN